MSMKDYEKIKLEDDNRVVADMSEIEPHPILMPKIGGFRKSKSENPQPQAPVHLDREEKRAFIGGVLSAGLLVGLIIAAAFGALILLIGSVG